MAELNVHILEIDAAGKDLRSFISKTNSGGKVPLSRADSATVLALFDRVRNVAIQALLVRSEALACSEQLKVQLADLRAEYSSLLQQNPVPRS